MLDALRQSRGAFKVCFTKLSGIFDPSSTVMFRKVRSEGHYDAWTAVLAPGPTSLAGGGMATPTAWNTFPATPLSGGRRM